MTIEHPDFGRVEGVDKNKDFRTTIFTKNGAKYFYSDGWREVLQARDVTGECDHGDKPCSVLQVPNPSTGYWKHLDLPTGMEWRKVQAVVLPEDWGEAQGMFRGIYKCIVEDKFTLNQTIQGIKHLQTTCLQIWEGER